MLYFARSEGKIFDIAFLSRSNPWNTTFCTILCAAKEFFLTFASLSGRNPWRTTFCIILRAAKKILDFCDKKRRFMPAGPVQRKKKEKKKKKDLARPPREHCASIFFPSCFPPVRPHTHSHFLQSISRFAPKGTPAKLQ